MCAVLSGIGGVECAQCKPSCVYKAEIRFIVFHMLVNEIDIRDFISRVTNGDNFALKEELI